MCLFVLKVILSTMIIVHGLTHAIKSRVRAIDNSSSVSVNLSLVRFSGGVGYLRDWKPKALEVHTVVETENQRA